MSDQLETLEKELIKIRSGGISPITLRQKEKGN
jgi:hypothetical protein